MPIYQPPKLTSQQSEVLKRFILRFLPKRGNKRKNSGNELEYLTNAISRLFSKNFGFKISRTDLLTAFEELEYSIFTKNGDWDAEAKDFKASEKGDTIRLDEGYKNYSAMFIYIDVEALVVRKLRLATAGLPPNSGEERIKERNEMQMQMDMFKQTVKEFL